MAEKQVQGDTRETPNSVLTTRKYEIKCWTERMVNIRTSSTSREKGEGQEQAYILNFQLLKTGKFWISNPQAVKNWYYLHQIVKMQLQS
jgi:hypothetical protein